MFALLGIAIYAAPQHERCVADAVLTCRNEPGGNGTHAGCRARQSRSAEFAAEPDGADRLWSLAVRHGGRI